MINKIINTSILLVFLTSLAFFSYQSYEQITKNLDERAYYASLFDTYVKQTSDTPINNTIKVLSQWGLTLTISKIKKDIQQTQIQESLLEQQEQQKTILDLSKENVDYSNTSIYIPWYVEKNKNVKVIFPTNNTTIYSDLKKWVRVAPESQKPHEMWITFIEWHSWQNYSNTLSYSFFDNLSLYYDNIDYNLPVFIETKDYKFEYHLFKKEIILPWEKEFYQSDFHHLIIMTCYPRNTSKKRALFHAKLISITKK